MFKKILIVLAVILVVFAIVVSLQSPHFRIERNATIAAPPAIVFAQVNDFHKWEAWSPWAKLDPAMKQTFEGAPAGVSAAYSWAGNKDVGEGRMALVESHPNESIRIKLEFLKPFRATSTTEFTFKPSGDQTVVTWSMAGENNFISRAMCMFMNMDKMVGGDFEKGLASMKTVSETAAGK